MNLIDRLFRVVVTAIVINQDGKCLITRRHKDKKRWPGKWTIPGGHVSTEDYLGLPTAINNQWYHVLENAVQREVKEETGLDIYDVKYLCSIAVEDAIVISFETLLEPNSDEKVVLQLDECDAYEWVSLKEAANFDLIDGLFMELERSRVCR